jgi:nucleotide-binding universal stress UspA family protein
MVHGTPHTAILDYAEEHGVDLVVMGTHGRRGFDRFLLGSVTEKVVRTASVPVMTVRVGEEG